MREIRVEYANAGYRPMVELLKQNGIHAHHKKVQRLMKKLGLRVTSYWRKSRKYNSYKGTVGQVAKNKLHRRFNTSVHIKNSQQIQQNSNIMLMVFRKNVISILILTCFTTKLLALKFRNARLIKLSLSL